MLNELSKNLNKQVSVTLVNGNEKYGTIVSIDAESNIIRLRDEANNSISILISMIGMLESTNIIKPIKKEQILQSEQNEIAINTQSVQHTTPLNKINDKIENISDKNNENPSDNYELLQKLTKIEIIFDTEIKNSVLKPNKPNFETPSDILDLDAYSRRNELNKWNWIKNKYDYAIKIGRLAPNSDELKAIIDKTKSLNQNLKLSNSYILRSYLGYFNYINSNFSESLKAYMQAAKLADKQENWLNMASVSIENHKNEMACYALSQLFLLTDCTESDYEKEWYILTGLILEFSAYNFYKILFNNASRSLSGKEQRKIFDTVCYCLLKKNLQGVARTQLQNSLGNPDYKKLCLECLDVLPQYPVSIYDSFRHEFEKLSVKPDIVKPKASFPPVYSYKKSAGNKYIDLLREARQEKTIAKNYEKAKDLFIQGIQQEQKIDAKERAVRDLASMLAQQMNQPENAIQVIKEYQTCLSESDLNLLYNFYYQAGKYEEAIAIQKKLIKNTIGIDARLTRYFNTAACYLKLENFMEAEKHYRDALKLKPAHFSIKRNIALCLFKQNKIDDAKRILEELISRFGDAKSIELLDNINNENINEIDDIIIDTVGLVFENLDVFTHFYLSSCDWKYVDKKRLSEEGKYTGNDNDKRFDIRKLESTADTLKRRIAEERSNIYLNAARILFDLGEINNEFYIYMCKCFTSKADNAVESGNSPDTVKAFYLTALKVYDSLYLDENKSKKPEADAIKSLCRFIYSFLGRDKIPLTAVNIKEAIETVFSQHPNSTKLFDAICLLFAKSPQYSISRVLKIIYENIDLRNESLVYLKSETNISYDSFIKIWKNKARTIIKIENKMSEQLSLLRKFEISEVWLNSGVKRINNVISQVLFESDKDYLIDLQMLLDSCITLCKAESYDEKINKCDDIEQKASIFHGKITKNPTKLSIEEILPIIENLNGTLETYLYNLNQASKPELVISSAVVSYHIKQNDQIDLQVKIENIAEGHAEQVELIIEKNDSFYDILNLQNISYGTIRGNDNETQIIVLQLSQEVISAKAFTLKSYTKFRTRQGENIESSLQELPIQLGDAKDFLEIKPNPYAQWARGGTVVDESMFFGRNDFINRAYAAICNNYRSYVIYGQFRSGKSSILHHLEKKLRSNDKILVAEVGDVGRLMDDNSPTPLLYQMLFGILRRVDKSIRDKKRNGLPQLNFYIPQSLDFYKHPAPVDYFYELFELFKEERNQYLEWKDIQIVITMDEFTYLYEKIIRGKLSQDFMKNWKALLAANYFNVVLVAQDVFPKFRNKYDNAFQTMEHERVSYLNKTAAKELIDNPVRISVDETLESESRYTENEAIERIIELTACSPYYIQIFCNQLVDYINSEKQPYITKANVNIIKDRLIRGDKRLDKTAFTNLINNGDPSPDALPHNELIKVIKSIAQNTKNDFYCIKNKINCETSSDLNEILKGLEERDVIEKHGEKGFRIRVGLFKEWLNENPELLE